MESSQKALEGRRTTLWSARGLRAFLAQAALVTAIALALWAASRNALDNMHAHGMPTGLSFWNEPAGFDVNQTLIPFQASTSTYGDAFFVGLLNTLLVSVLGVLFATLIGFAIGVARLSSNFLVSKLAGAYVETIRNVPLLLQLLFWYNAVLKQLPAPRQSVALLHAVFLNDRGLILPAPVFSRGAGLVLGALIAGAALSAILARLAHRRQARTGETSRIWPALAALLIGLPILAYFVAGRPIDLVPPTLRGFNFVGGLRVLPEFAALLLGLSIYTASFIAEVVRAGLLAVDRGQIEAARALGLSGGLTMRLIVLPQSMRLVIPPLTNQYLNLIKNSSLAVFIGYPDLVQVFAGTVLNQTGAAIQVIGITMAVYLAISLATSAAMEAFNRRMALVER